MGKLSAQPPGFFAPDPQQSPLSFRRCYKGEFKRTTKKCHSCQIPNTNLKVSRNALQERAASIGESFRRARTLMLHSSSFFTGVRITAFAWATSRGKQASEGLRFMRTTPRKTTCCFRSSAESSRLCSRSAHRALVHWTLRLSSPTSTTHREFIAL